MHCTRVTGGALLFAFMACTSRAPGSPPAQSASNVQAELDRRAHSARNAAELLVWSRCRRELRCGTLGPGKKYASPTDCAQKVQAEWAGDLVAFECRQRLLGDELEDCLGAIHDQDCDSPFDTVARLSTCTPRQVCLR